MTDDDNNDDDDHHLVQLTNESARMQHFLSPSDVVDDGRECE